MAVFENYFEVTEKLYCEAMEKMVPMMRYVIYTVAAIFLGVSGGIMLIGKNYPTGSIWVVIALLLFFYGFYGIKLRARKFYRAQLPSICGSNGIFSKKTVFLDNGFKVIEPKNSATFKYSDIQGVNESKNLYVIILKERKLLFVKKGAFTSGTDSEFISFLKKKCHAE